MREFCTRLFVSPEHWQRLAKPELLFNSSLIIFLRRHYASGRLLNFLSFHMQIGIPTGTVFGGGILIAMDGASR
jgi:hypothetical protein